MVPRPGSRPQGSEDDTDDTRVSSRGSRATQACALRPSWQGSGWLPSGTPDGPEADSSGRCGEPKPSGRARRLGTDGAHAAGPLAATAGQVAHLEIVLGGGDYEGRRPQPSYPRSL